VAPLCAGEEYGQFLLSDADLLLVLPLSLGDQIESAARHGWVLGALREGSPTQLHIQRVGHTRAGAASPEGLEPIGMYRQEPGGLTVLEASEASRLNRTPLPVRVFLSVSTVGDQEHRVVVFLPDAGRFDAGIRPIATLLLPRRVAQALSSATPAAAAIGPQAKPEAGLRLGGWGRVGWALCLGLVGCLAWREWVYRRVGSPAAPVLAAQPVRVEPVPSMGLRAERMQGRVLVRWNGDSSEVLERSRGGWLELSSHGQRQQLALGREQVRTGSVLLNDVPDGATITLKLIGAEDRWVEQATEVPGRVVMALASVPSDQVPATPALSRASSETKGLERGSGARPRSSVASRRLRSPEPAQSESKGVRAKLGRFGRKVVRIVSFGRSGGSR
jgi:hypothetical protein